MKIANDENSQTKSFGAFGAKMVETMKIENDEISA